MAKKSFRDSVTGVLKAWGYISSNQPGDLVRDESDDLNLEPGKWKWNGSTWISFTPPPPPPSALKIALDIAILDLTIPQNVRNVLIGLRAQFNIQ